MTPTVGLHTACIHHRFHIVKSVCYQKKPILLLVWQRQRSLGFIPKTMRKLKNIASREFILLWWLTHVGSKDGRSEKMMLKCSRDIWFLGHFETYLPHYFWNDPEVCSTWCGFTWIELSTFSLILIDHRDSGVCQYCLVWRQGEDILNHHQLRLGTNKGQSTKFNVAKNKTQHSCPPSQCRW